ncbi:MAG: hypothetical protein ACAH08_01890 [Methylophilus sp.]|uniref:hypothetical protein n=1 Tax=Methylophilus sp. TaxID=29541 RepID=UPI002B83F180|nr:hypothetical protein [Methylophilus sp.]HSH87059.1 hypothetical protein [Methylophilus sp.]
MAKLNLSRQEETAHIPHPMSHIDSFKAQKTAASRAALLVGAGAVVVVVPVAIMSLMLFLIGA